MTSPILLVSYVAVVSDNDGSAFITKAEFDSLKNNFQAQIDNYNQSIDSKIDGAIAAYLAGIKIETGQAFDVDWLADWNQVSEMGKSGKAVHFTYARNNNIVRASGYPIPKGDYMSDPNNVFVETFWRRISKPGMDTWADFGPSARASAYDKIEDMIVMYGLCNSANTNMRIGQRGTDSNDLRMLKGTTTTGSYTDRPEGFWPLDWTMGSYSNRNYIDKRWEGLVPWDVFIGYKGIDDPKYYGKWFVFPILKGIDGTGRLKMRFQCDCPWENVNEEFSTMARSSTVGMGGDAGFQFQVLSSVGEIKSIVGYNGSDLQPNPWELNYSSGWVETDEFEMREGEYFCVAMSPHEAWQNNCSTGRMIFNFTKLT